MTEAIIVGLISAGACIITNLITANKNQAIIENEIKHIKEEQGEIKTRLDTHNNYAKKIGNIEISLAEMSKDIAYLKEKTK